MQKLRELLGQFKVPDIDGAFCRQLRAFFLGIWDEQFPRVDPTTLEVLQRARSIVCYLNMVTLDLPDADRQELCDAVREGVEDLRQFLANLARSEAEIAANRVAHPAPIPS